MERWKPEVELSEREERLREHVIRSMSNGLVTVDLDGRIAALSLLGRDDRQVLREPGVRAARPMHRTGAEQTGCAQRLRKHSYMHRLCIR